MLANYILIPFCLLEFLRFVFFNEWLLWSDLIHLTIQMSILFVNKTEHAVENEIYAIWI